MNPPLVSALIPAHVGARNIRKALDMVFAQNHPSRDVVVDDCSKDETLQSCAP
jgi:glycosyltransferase involved in cell wall biosynthesis